ncbi:MAG: 30S ribosomal protein S3 [Candidatus Aenigmarchaeota archaeon]|nr:30S ribosomal protein S3 [Candidatus Aenigmarchaeota archaeon]
MGVNKYFVNQSIREVSIDAFIRENFPTTDYSDIELQRTPLGIKVIIYTHKPGRVIGRGGSKINQMSEMLKQKFDLDNPQLDVKSIPNPNLDAKIVAKQIKSSLERGYNFKKIGNLSMKKVMEAGAVGVEIVISGKLGGSKGRVGKFLAGYIKHCGFPAEELVDFGFEEAITRPGKIGIKVKIMKEIRDIAGQIVRTSEKKRAVEKKEEIKHEVTQDDLVVKDDGLDFDYSVDYEEAELDEELAEEKKKKTNKRKETKK